MTIIKDEDKTLVTFSRPMKSISSAILGGGIKRDVLCIANVTIPQDINISVSSMPNYSRKIITKSGYFAKNSVVLLTSVPQKYIGISTNGKCITTAGLGNACPLVPEMVWDEGIDGLVRYSPGTINCIVALYDCLTTAAMVEGYGVIKMAIAEIISSWSSYVGMQSCVGTPTDCVALLCPKHSVRINKFAGIGTKIGADIVYAVRESLLSSINYRYPEFKFACSVESNY